MRPLLPIQARNFDWYQREIRRWIAAINEYTAQSSNNSKFNFPGASSAFYSPFADDAGLILKGLREGFDDILGLQIEAVCQYLDVTREYLESIYFL